MHKLGSPLIWNDMPTKKPNRTRVSGRNLVLFDPDVASAFRTECAVNRALRALLKKRSRG